MTTFNDNFHDLGIWYISFHSIKNYHASNLGTQYGISYKTNISTDTKAQLSKQLNHQVFFIANET